MAASVEELLAQFIGLYTRDTLPAWRKLLRPEFTAAAANADGSVSTWSLDEFYDRQRQIFTTGKPVSEVLERTRIEQSGSLACAWSDYVWTDGEARRPGRLMMLLVAERGEWKVQALTFSYLG